MSSYILSLDQGTTSSRSVLFDKNGAVVAFSQREFTQLFPEPGQVEHDPEEIWESQLATAREVIQKAGVVMVADLKELNPNKFHQDICGINKKNKLGLTNPSKEEVAAWIEQVSR